MPVRGLSPILNRSFPEKRKEADVDGDTSAWTYDDLF